MLNTTLDSAFKIKKKVKMNDWKKRKFFLFNSKKKIKLCKF